MCIKSWSIMMKRFDLISSWKLVIFDSIRCQSIFMRYCQPVMSCLGLQYDGNRKLTFPSISISLRICSLRRLWTLIRIAPASMSWLLWLSHPLLRLLDSKRITLVESALLELGTNKARIWPLTQELNPQSTLNSFHICKENMPFSHVQCTWTCFLSALLMALLTGQSKGAVHANRRTRLIMPVEAALT